MKLQPYKPITLARQKYYAIVHDAGPNCSKCAFTTPESVPASPECMAVPCQNVIWLTEPDYILHRLTN